MVPQWNIFSWKFQSTLPRGERLQVDVHGYYPNIFQSTLPRGERLTLRALYCCFIHFNPRSHEGGDDLIRDIAPVTTISIHAPTRGATKGFCCLACLLTISIHAPTRGATLARISISPYPEFQSTLPRGERLVFTVIYVEVLRFQSTLPRGERRILFVGEYFST